MARSPHQVQASGYSCRQLSSLSSNRPESPMRPANASLYANSRSCWRRENLDGHEAAAASSANAAVRDRGHRPRWRWGEIRSTLMLARRSAMTASASGNACAGDVREGAQRRAKHTAMPLSTKFRKTRPTQSRYGGCPSGADRSRCDDGVATGDTKAPYGSTAPS
jgi:hypothetical protein